MGTINFDSTDWDSIKDTINKVNEVGCMQLGQTSDGEDITFDVTKDGKLHTAVYQKNGWVRHNYYDPEECTVEEILKESEDEYMNIIEVLHSYWVGERHDAQKVRDSWRKVDGEVKQYLPGDKQDDFLCLLNEHCYKVEYQGFLAGFRMATAIWKKMK